VVLHISSDQVSNTLTDFVIFKCRWCPYINRGYLFH
jgi:hypothetical protein